MSPAPADDSRSLARLLRPHAGRWAALAFAVALSSALLLAGPLVIREIVDRATGEIVQAVDLPGPSEHEIK